MTLVEFFHAVHSDPKARADLAGMYEEMIAEHGMDLTQRQVAAVRNGDAFKVGELIKTENAGAEPRMSDPPVITWTIGVVDMPR